MCFFQRASARVVNSEGNHVSQLEMITWEVEISYQHEDLSAFRQQMCDNGLYPVTCILNKC